MKILGADLVIKRGFKAQGAVFLDSVFSQRNDLYTNEKALRCFCAAALHRAQKKSMKKLVFFCGDHALELFPKTATAKILAQEIYRHLRQDRSALKKIVVGVYGQENARFFSRIVFGYLKHLTEDLAYGPFVTADVIIETPKGIVLIKRSNPPFGWALPGGFLDYGESLEETAVREVREETGLRVTNLEQMRIYSRQGRDPRFQTVTTVFVARSKGKPQAASDAAEAAVFDPASWKKLHLAFDHAKILSDYLAWKKSRES